MGELRSTAPARGLNRTQNSWARNRLAAVFRRKANLAGITVIEAPDSCPSAMEIARRGIAASAKLKNLLPVFDEGWRDGLWKDLRCPPKPRVGRRSTGISTRRSLAFAARIRGLQPRIQEAA